MQFLKPGFALKGDNPQFTTQPLNLFIVSVSELLFVFFNTLNQPMLKGFLGNVSCNTAQDTCRNECINYICPIYDALS